MKLVAAGLLSVVAVLAAGCSADVADEEANSSEDKIVATFDGNGNIDVKKTSRILLVGDSDELGELPLYAAITRAHRYRQLHPNDQIVLFVTGDVSGSKVASTGAEVVNSGRIGGNVLGGGVRISDLSRLTSPKLVEALDRFTRIASIDFFGHSSPWGPLLEASGTGRTLGPTAPVNLSVLKDNFARDTFPYVTLNGCNGGTSVAPTLSRMWQLPVAGALTGTNFQVLMSDNRWYMNDDGSFPPELTRKEKNDLSYGPSLAPACETACVRMKPQDSPYRGVWANKETGFQFGLNYYKFFCDFEDTAACSKGMANSLYAFPSTRPIDKNASDEELDEVLADFFCTGNKDATWFDTCKANLFKSASEHSAFSPMKSANDYSLECSFKGCDQKFRCEGGDNPQKGTCVWVNASCSSDDPSDCRSKNTSKQTTWKEVARYRDGHHLLRGN